MDWKRAGLFGVSTAIILGMIYFADFQQVLSTAQNADKIILASAIFVGLLNLPIWANSWHKLINRVGGNVSFFKALKMFTAGNFLNSVTPLGQFGGEPLMAYVIKKNTDLEYEEGLSAVVSADIINAIPIFTFIIGGSAYLLFFNSMNSILLEMSYIALVIMALGGSIAYLLWFKSGFLESKFIYILKLLSRPFGKESSLVEKVEEKMDGMQKAFRTVGEEPKELLKISLVAHLFFVCQVISLYLVMLSVGVDTDLTPLYFVLPTAALANFSPTPGGSGTYEVILAGVLTAFIGVPGTTAVTIAILYRFTTFWPSIVLGYVSLLSLSDMDLSGIKKFSENP
ncbi:MAG: lysylphosphatidylglycerol synthase transmembrane domain-containing protein [Candidatus Nanohaloarchaea archaeon]